MPAISALEESLSIEPIKMTVEFKSGYESTEEYLNSMDVFEKLEGREKIKVC